MTITELPFLRELIKLNIAGIPVWVDYDFNMNVFLMEDMGGNELPWQSDVETFRKVILEYCKIQKQSIPHLPLKCRHNDYRIATIIDKLNDFPKKASQILRRIKYAITKEESKKLDRKIKSAAVMLKSISRTKIPDTIRHGDFRPGNIRETNGKYIFYDWSWGSISNPFFDISVFLHIIRRNLPANAPAKEILVDAYLREWLEYGTYEEVKNTFDTLDGLIELFILFDEYCFVGAMYSVSDDNTAPMSADGWLLEKEKLTLGSWIKEYIKNGKIL